MTPKSLLRHKQAVSPVDELGADTTFHRILYDDMARPLERLALYLDDPAAKIRPNEPRKVDPRLIAIHYGSGSERKNWPLDRFVILSRSLLRQDPGRKLLLVAGEADRVRGQALKELLPPDRVQVAEDLPLTTLANLLQNCAGFVGHDSGISHLAAAVGTPSLLLFGPTDPVIWAPQNPQVQILRSRSRTMEGIKTEEVLHSLGELMS